MSSNKPNKIIILVARVPIVNWLKFYFFLQNLFVFGQNLANFTLKPKKIEKILKNLIIVAASVNKLIFLDFRSFVSKQVCGISDVRMFDFLIFCFFFFLFFFFTTFLLARLFHIVWFFLFFPSFSFVSYVGTIYLSFFSFMWRHFLAPEHGFRDTATIG